MNTNDCIIIPEECWTKQKIFDQLKGDVSGLTADDISETYATWWAREWYKLRDRILIDEWQADVGLADHLDDDYVYASDELETLNDKLIDMVRSNKPRR